MENVRVVLVDDDPGRRAELASALEAAPDLFVAATSLEAARGGEVVVAGGAELDRLASGRARAPVIALAGGDPIRAARSALAAGARELLRWPEDRDRLADAVRAAALEPAAEAPPSGRVVAVLGARGGAGATVFAAALARAFAGWSEGTILLDLDSASCGQTVFARAAPERTRADLERLGPGVGSGTLSAALAPHAAGVRALFGPARPAPFGEAAAHAIAGGARRLARVAVADLGRCAARGESAAAALADARVVVVASDVAAVRGAAALAERLDMPADVVLRRTGRARTSRRDVERALGAAPAACYSDDRRTARAAALGRLPRRSPLVRAALRVAASLEVRWT